MCGKTGARNAYVLIKPLTILESRKMRPCGWIGKINEFSVKNNKGLQI